MLAKEIFACFLFIFSSFAQNVRRIVHFEPSSTSSFRLKPKPKPRPNPNPCARPGCPCCPRQDCSCCCCCCHSSIFVSLCSIRLKDCNIYLHLFSSLFFPAFAFASKDAGRRTTWVTVTSPAFTLVCFALGGNNNSNNALEQCILTSVFAAFYVIHGHSMPFSLCVCFCVYL